MSENKCQLCGQPTDEPVELPRSATTEQRLRDALENAAAVRHVFAIMPEVNAVGHEVVEGGFRACPHAACRQATAALAAPAVADSPGRTAAEELAEIADALDKEHGEDWRGKHLPHPEPCDVCALIQRLFMLARQQQDVTP